MSNTKILEGYTDVAQVAADLKKHPRTIHRWMEQPSGLPYVKIGRDRLIHIETARQWIFSRMQRPNPTHGRKAGAR